MSPEEKLSAGIVKLHRGQQVTNCGIGRTITEELIKYRKQIRKQAFRKAREMFVALEELE